MAISGVRGGLISPVRNVRQNSEPEVPGIFVEILDLLPKLMPLRVTDTTVQHNAYVETIEYIAYKTFQLVRICAGYSQEWDAGVSAWVLCRSLCKSTSIRSERFFCYMVRTICDNPTRQMVQHEKLSGNAKIFIESVIQWVTICKERIYYSEISADEFAGIVMRAMEEKNRNYSFILTKAGCIKQLRVALKANNLTVVRRALTTLSELTTPVAAKDLINRLTLGNKPLLSYFLFLKCRDNYGDSETSIEIIKLLQTYGARLGWYGLQGWWEEERCERWGHHLIENILLKISANLNDEFFQFVMIFIFNEAWSLYAQNSRLPVQSADNTSSAYWKLCCRIFREFVNEGDVGFTRFLLESMSCKAQKRNILNIKLDIGTTLHAILYSPTCSIEMVNLLLEHGAEVSRQAQILGAIHGRSFVMDLTPAQLAEALAAQADVTQERQALLRHIAWVLSSQADSAVSSTG